MSGREEGGPQCLGCHWQTGPHNYQSDRTARPADDLNIALLNFHPSKHIPRPAHLLPTHPQQHTARNTSHSYTHSPSLTSCGKPTSRSQTRTEHVSAYPHSSMIDEVSITFCTSLCTACISRAHQSEVGKRLTALWVRPRPTNTGVSAAQLATLAV